MAGKPYVVNHKLKSKDVSVRAFDNKGKPVKGAITVINTNKLEFVPEESAEGGRIMATRITSYNVCYTKLLRI